MWRDKSEPNDFKTFLEALNQKCHGFTVQEYLDYHNVKKNKALFINLILSTIFANKEVGKRKENESEPVFGQHIGELIWEQLKERYK